MLTNYKLSAPIHRAEFTEPFYHMYKLGEVNSESHAEFCFHLEHAIAAGQETFLLEVDSMGGDVYAALSFVSTILNSPIPVIAYCSNLAASAGFLIFVMCKYRIAAPIASFMYHEVRVHSGPTTNTTEELIVNTQEVERLNLIMRNMVADALDTKVENLDKLFSGATRKSATRSPKSRNVDKTFTAKQALEMGACDAVDFVRLNVEIKPVVSYTFAPATSRVETYTEAEMLDTLNLDPREALVARWCGADQEYDAYSVTNLTTDEDDSDV